jgi:hypothetical protein
MEALASLRPRGAVGGLRKLWEQRDRLVSLQIPSPTIGPPLPLVWNTLKQLLALDPGAKARAPQTRSF